MPHEPSSIQPQRVYSVLDLIKLPKLAPRRTNELALQKYSSDRALA